MNSYIEQNIGIANNFLSEGLAIQLRNHLLTLYNQEQFKVAGIGNNAKLVQNKAIRSDVIYWLDRKHKNPIENRFFNRMDKFVRFLNETCYTGITGYEFHYAMYEPGSFYKRHIDQFKDNQNRAFTMIMYLNPYWKKGDGGELCIYQNNQATLVTPNYRKGVFFKSNQLEHEVLLSYQPRLSITGWLKVG